MPYLNKVATWSFPTSNPELAQWLDKIKKKDIIEKTSHPDLIKKLYIQLLDLELDDKTKRDYESLIYNFASWYSSNQWELEIYGASILNSKDPFSDQFHQNLVERLLEIFATINALPNEFDEIKLTLKKKLVHIISNYFLRNFDVKNTRM